MDGVTSENPGRPADRGGGDGSGGGDGFGDGGRGAYGGAAERWRERLRRLLWAGAGNVVCVVAAFFLGAMATDISGVDGNPDNDLAGLLALLALWGRRRWPLTVAAVTFTATAVAPFAAGAAIVCVYTIAAYHRRRPGSRPVLALLALLYLAAGTVRLAVADAEQGDALVLLVTAAVVLTAAAYGWGLAVRSRQQVMVMLAERAERAEAEQYARVQQARRAERARIAAEMHDVLAHRLSMLSLHAGAIELRPEAPPEDRARAAAVVRTSAHQALVELREVIGVLRADGAAALAPQPSAGELDALIAECRAAGMRIERTGTLPDPDAIPPELGRHLYRIVQEGLTNARKHAPGAAVRLELSGAAGDGITVTVSNPLTGAAGARAGSVPPAGDAAGAGAAGAFAGGAFADGAVPAAEALPAAEARPPAVPPGGVVRPAAAVPTAVGGPAVAAAVPGPGPGPAPAPGAPVAPGARVPGAGVGLIGLRERVDLAGGTLDRQADDGGRHRLRAWLPWPA